MSDLMHQDLLPVQSDKNNRPATIASAATIVPLTRYSIITGAVQIATITPPVTGYHELVLCFTNAAPGAFATSGNIKTAYQPIQNRPCVLYYEPAEGKYYSGTVT